MIVECKKDGNLLNIVSENSKHVVNINNLQDFLYNSDYILARINNGKDDKVLVINGDGDICFRLVNDANFYIGYLQVHPRYGNCVVASELIEDKWVDGYYAYTEGVGFLRKNQTR